MEYKLWRRQIVVVFRRQCVRAAEQLALDCLAVPPLAGKGSANLADELAPFGNHHSDETCEFRRAPRRHTDECSNGLDEAVTFVLDVELKLLVEKHHCATRRPALLAGEAHGGTPQQKYAAA